MLVDGVFDPYFVSQISKQQAFNGNEGMLEMHIFSLQSSALNPLFS